MSKKTLPEQKAAVAGNYPSVAYPAFSGISDDPRATTINEAVSLYENSIFMRLYSIFLLCLAALGRASAQDLDCGSDLLFQRQLATDPVFKARHEAMEQARYQFVTTHKPSAGQQDASPASYVLPVVFHIIHQNGPENTSDARIQQDGSDLAQTQTDGSFEVIMGMTKKVNK